ncbi:NUDIX domain-containing protein [Lewinella cohaerens]|uniref:NUDIX domain-containing protein n=1 Tax=Lewinella cohaerens TaxID=70995 RepID=UPI00036DBCF5|nr:NUDIX domain-containing protein [Lewinella cohaerens]
MPTVKTVIKARVILYDHGRILLLKQTKPNGGNYTLVGGTVEAEEFAQQCLIRESKEEAGITLEQKDLTLVHVMHKRSKNEHRIGLFFKASRWEGKLRAREKEKFKAAHWFDLDRLPTNLTPTIQQVLKCYRKGIFYSEMSKKSESKVRGQLNTR